jgi:processive 1,2-diacylglycerol beta-glucosyltransferase/1,2-diacylglycerol 3-beta-galactosyltransferase
MKDKKKYLFLYLRTGGGHLAPAKAIADYYNKHHAQEIEPILYDGFETSHKLIKYIIIDGYRILQNKHRFIFKLIYAYHKIRLVSHSASFLVNLFLEKQLEKKIIETNPDKIIIVHFFLIKAVYKILKNKKLKIPVLTIVTDPFTSHPLWFLNKKQNFIIFSEILKEHIVRKGIDPYQIKILPFPLSEKFSTIPSGEEKKEFKKELGFKTERILLLLGGGDGIPKGIQILKNLCKNPIDYEIALVCGNNKELYNDVLKWRDKNKITSIKVFGYTDKIFELINISDAVITKCGASTIMEILILKKIPVVNSYIWEQEKGNVEFLIQNKLGFYETKISKLPNLIRKIFNEDKILAENKMIIQNGTDQIVKYISDFAC